MSLPFRDYYIYTICEGEGSWLHDEVTHTGVRMFTLHSKIISFMQVLVCIRKWYGSQIKDNYNMTNT